MNVRCTHNYIERIRVVVRKVAYHKEKVETGHNGSTNLNVLLHVQIWRVKV